MLKLTHDDWAEIYYALESKLDELRQGRLGNELEKGEDKKWVLHLEAIKKLIGPDGSSAAFLGVASVK
ncbi:MAG TPA: hypothetical protein VMT61_15515 [Candidatus Binataceae bacterium]|nr:hypothetical protein [Candidatus Binataceae bacterium]